MKRILISLLALTTSIYAVEGNEYKVETPSEEVVDINEDSEYEVRKEERERFFPMFRDGIEARNIQLPLPFGVSVLGNVTNVQSKATRLQTSLSTNNYPNGLTLEEFSVDADLTAKIAGVMLDFYPMPFLNLYGFASHIRTSGTLDIKLRSDGKTFTKEDFGDTGFTYGFGANVAGGYKNLFVGLNMVYSFTEMDRSGAQKNTYIITPRVGLKNEKNTFQVWTGLMYMNKQSTLKGDMIGLGPLPDFSYEMDLDNPEFSPTLGFRYEPLRHFEIIGEIFLAKDFNGINIRTGYRF